MSDTRFMQTVLFGGYERSAVEKRFESLNTQLFSLKSELREAKLLLSELRSGSDESAALEKILAGERVTMAEVQAKNETFSKKLRTAEDELAERDQEIEKLKAQITELQDELTQKTEKLTYLEANSDGEALSAVFIEAQKSADLLVNMAKKDAAALETNSKRLADNLVTEANNTAKKLIYDAEVRSSEMLTDAENRSAHLETASENLKATVLEDVSRLMKEVSALKNAFGKFQQSGLGALSDAEQVLTETDSNLKTGGLPVFRAPATFEGKRPEPPELEPVEHAYYTEADTAAAEAKIQREEELKRLRAMANSINESHTAAAEPDPLPEPEILPEPEPEQIKPAEPEKPQTRPAPEPAAPKEPEQPHEPPASETVGKIVPDLAALAAQADALSQQGKKKYKYPGRKKIE